MNNWTKNNYTHLYQTEKIKFKDNINFVYVCKHVSKKLNQSSPLRFNSKRL